MNFLLRQLLHKQAMNSQASRMSLGPFSIELGALAPDELFFHQNGNLKDQSPGERNNLRNVL